MVNTSLVLERSDPRRVAERCDYLVQGAEHEKMFKRVTADVENVKREVTEYKDELVVGDSVHHCLAQHT